jgi:hypothetical protein
MLFLGLDLGARWSHLSILGNERSSGPLMLLPSSEPASIYQGSACRAPDALLCSRKEKRIASCLEGMVEPPDGKSTSLTPTFVPLPLAMSTRRHILSL